MRCLPVERNRLIHRQQPTSDGHGPKPHPGQMRHDKDILIRIPVLARRQDAKRLGLSEYALSGRARTLQPFPGVYVHPTATELLRAPSWVDDYWLDVHTRVRALQLQRPDAVVSHATAAFLLGWPIPYVVHGPIDVTTPRSRMRRTGVRGHGPRDVAAAAHRGVTMVRQSEALRGISGSCTSRQLITVIDTICGTWHGPPAARPDDIRRMVEESPRFNGSEALRAALISARAGVGSPRETDLRLLIVAAGLPEPVVSCAVRFDDETLHPDLSYPELLIAIEYEGDHHRADPRQWDIDIARERVFRDAGWEYIRVTRSTRPETIIRLIRTALERRRGTVIRAA